MATKKKILLHPSNPKTGQPILDVELYPETLKTGIVNLDGTNAVDSTVTANSANLITSGAVKTYVDGTKVPIAIGNDTDAGITTTNGDAVLLASSEYGPTLGNDELDTTISGDNVYITTGDDGKLYVNGDEVSSTIVSVSSEGTSQSTVSYITINGTEYKFAASATAGVSSIGGKAGVITIDDNLTISDSNILGLNKDLDLDGGSIDFGNRAFTKILADTSAECLKFKIGNHYISLPGNLSEDTDFALWSDIASQSAASGGTTQTLVTTGEKYIWNHKQNALTAGTGIIISGNTISASGGGAAYMHKVVITRDDENQTTVTLNFISSSSQPIEGNLSSIEAVEDKLFKNCIINKGYDNIMAGTVTNVTGYIKIDYIDTSASPLSAETINITTQGFTSIVDTVTAL